MSRQGDVVGVRLRSPGEHLLVIAVVAFIIWGIVKKGAHPLGKRMLARDCI